ncbi:MAG: PKD domain-containing protein [Thermoplasmatales archaeon]|nr:MAG: PKD domain-containing protein [Thermoplasmatales archaeon]
MRYNLNEKWLALGTTVLLVGLILGSIGNAVIIENKQVSNMPADNGMSLNLNESYTNLTVFEVWDMLNDTSNGIQIPIDVRTDGEWKNEHIDTPLPEHPQHYRLDLLQNETWLQEFMTLYEGEEVILYCKSGYRSFVATNILVDNNFTGTIYNMPGGILGWKAAGLPTHGNQPPDAPMITGPTEGKAGVEYEYTFNATDPDGEDVYYYIDWGDDNYSGWFGPYFSGENVSVNHTWDEMGTYDINAKAKDIYDDEGNWSEPFTIVIVEPIIEIGKITGRFFKIKAKIKNIGNGTADNVSWNITLIGGSISKGRYSSGEIEIIPANGETTVRSESIFGFGKIVVKVTVEISGDASDTKWQDAFAILFFVLML